MIDFYRSWLERLPALSDGYIYNEKGVLHPTRTLFNRLKEFLKNLSNGTLDDNEKIILLPGIRGVGKTTLLMQLFNIEKIHRLESDSGLLSAVGRVDERMYIDAAKLTLEDITLKEFFDYFENIRDLRFEALKKKCLFLIDEIHYDEQWGLFLKNLYDRTTGHKNILVIATGSSALHLRMNPDLSRRTTTLDVYPLTFSEFMKLKHSAAPSEKMSVDLQSIIFESKSVQDIYSAVRETSTPVRQYFSSIPSNAISEFFEIGGFPFTLSLKNKIKSIELIKNIIDSMIIKDVAALKRFNTQTLTKINQLLYLIAISDKVSYEKLQRSLRISEFRTVESLIEVLEQSGILVKIGSYGRGYGPTRKTPKFLFITPSLRSGIIDNQYTSAIEGKKLEDYFILIYKTLTKEKSYARLSYDIAGGGADFIVSLKSTGNIIIEVGFHKESVEQLRTTKRKIKSGYGIVFGSASIELVDDTFVKLPLEYFLVL